MAPEIHFNIELTTSLTLKGSDLAINGFSAFKISRFGVFVNCGASSLRPVK